MRIFITGASGFVGQNLERYLRDADFDVERVFLRNPNWIHDISGQACAMIHLAGKAHDTTNTCDDQVYFSINRDLSIKLFDTFLKSEIRDFFYFSSVKAVADVVDGILYEDVKGYPFTPYGKSKLAAEQYIMSQALPEGKRLFIIRPCMIHGPGNKGNLNLLYKIVEKGIPWPLASFDNQRSFLSIDNLSFLIEAMIEKIDLPSGVYNFADDDALSTNDVVQLISETLGHKPKLWAISAALIKTVVKIGDILPLPLNSERLKKLTESYVVSNDKIKLALGIQHLPISVKEGLKRTIKSFQS